MRRKFQSGDIVKMSNCKIVGKIIKSHDVCGYETADYLIEYSGCSAVLNECFIERKATKGEAMLYKLENA